MSTCSSTKHFSLFFRGGGGDVWKIIYTCIVVNLNIRERMLFFGRFHQTNLSPIKKSIQTPLLLCRVISKCRKSPHCMCLCSFDTYMYQDINLHWILPLVFRSTETSFTEIAKVYQYWKVLHKTKQLPWLCNKYVYTGKDLCS